ncbi:MAG: HDIG domain-containing protein [Clostridiales bacterium]|nr:HDIG domain-containing protein [Clostridiales bacterium]
MVRKRNSQKNIHKKKPLRPARKVVPRLWLKIMMLFAFALLSAAILAIGIMPAQITSEVGEVASEDVFNTGSTHTYPSALGTEQARSEAASQVEAIYEIDDNVLSDFLSQINKDFATIDSLSMRNNIVLDSESRRASLRNALPGEFSDEMLNNVLNASFSEMYTMRQNLRDAVSAVYKRGVRELDLLKAKDDIAAILIRTPLSGEGLTFLLAYVNGLSLMPNDLYDFQASANALQAAVEAVSTVYVTVQYGEKLLSRGSLITAEQIEALQAVGMYSENPRYTPYGGLLIITLLFTLLMGLYLFYYQPKLFFQDKSILLLCVTMLLVLLLCRFIAFINFSANPEVSAHIGYLLPVATVAMLLALLLERNLAIFATVIFSVYVCVICKGQVAYGLTALSGGLAGILSTTRLNQRSQLVGASIYIALANMALIGGWGLLANQSYTVIGYGLLFGAGNGLLSAILAIGILPFLEGAFSVTTVMRLLELSNFNHPLLKKLMMEAPGTYNHSVLVGNLAETAADAIGADALMVRVASYYHDVGKLKRPYFFIENQGVNDNPHDKLQPSISVMIITSHVREGVEMLRKARFPEEIIALVEQHHGTGLLRIFYKKAQEQALDSSTVREENFRYPFSKPQSREAALVLLADITQAAVQSLKQADKGQIEDTVHGIFKGRMEDGQLLDCPITFQDMRLIEEAFLRVLSGMNHSRLLYPEQTAKDTGVDKLAYLLDDNPAMLALSDATAQSTAATSSPANN